MKHIFLVAIIIGLGILTRAQTEYEISGDGSNKVLKGLISRDLLTGDTAFAWFNGNKAGYTPDQQVISVLKSKGGQVQFLVFSGTWSEIPNASFPNSFPSSMPLPFPINSLPWWEWISRKKRLTICPKN